MLVRYVGFVSLRFFAVSALLAVSILTLPIETAASSFGPYTVIRSLPTPPGGIGDLEYAGGYLYSVEEPQG
jgi:hypothetical protein